ncbi:hypothetical protein RKD49_007828 [Streptomyces glaucescens]
MFARVRGANGAIHSVYSYDVYEKVWNDPMPLLYQWNPSGEKTDNLVQHGPRCPQRCAHGDWIDRCHRRGWLGEVEGISVSRDAAEEKLEQLDAIQEKKSSPIFIGSPAFIK